MEKFSKKRKMETITRSALAGISMLGAAEASQPTVAEAAPLSYEQQEQFNADVEAHALFDEVSHLEAGIDDARGRMTLKNKIADKFNTFALSYEQRTPFFSLKDAEQINGTVSYQSQKGAREFLLPKLATMSLHEGEPLWVLRAILTGSARTQSQELNSAGTRSSGHPEIRRNRTVDW